MKCFPFSMNFFELLRFVPAQRCRGRRVSQRTPFSGRGAFGAWSQRRTSQATRGSSAASAPRVLSPSLFPPFLCETLRLCVSARVKSLLQTHRKAVFQKQIKNREKTVFDMLKTGFSLCNLVLLLCSFVVFAKARLKFVVDIIAQMGKKA